MKTRLASGVVVGYDDVGRGRPLVLLHAFPLARGMWRPQAEALGTEHRVLAPDLRGFGETSPFDGAPSLERMADDVADWLDALGVREPVVLGGLSMGGYVALAFVRKHAGRLRGLILADTRAEADTPEGKANRDRMIEFARSHPAADVLEQLLPKLVSDATRQRRPEVVEEVRRLAGGQSPGGIIGALLAMRDRPDSTPLLAGVRVPALVVVGAEDALTPPALAEGLVRSLGDARLATIEWAGHLANLEQPAAFNAAVGSFLRSLG